MKATGMGMFDWVLGIIDGWGLAGIVMLMIAENVFPPIPSEVILPLAGFLAAEGRLPLAGVLAAGTAGAVAGTSLWYALGRAIGAARLKRWAARSGRWLVMTPGDIDTAQRWFDRRGPAAILIGRCIPAIRTLISVPAGVAAMPLGRFLLWTTLGSFVWTGVLTAAGFVLHANYTVVEGWIDPLSKAVILAVIGIYVWRVATWTPR